MHELASAISISLGVSLTATVLCSLGGIPLGCALAVNEFRGKTVIQNFLATLLAVPTVVVGLFVYSLIRRGSILGGLGLLFTPWAMILGQFFLALPITISFTHSACAAVEKQARDTAVTLGAGPYAAAAAVLSEARFGIMAAVAATFGRLIGEVGVAMMLGGNITGYTRTITTTIALETSKGEFGLGLRLGIILLCIAFGVNIALRTLQERGLRWKNR